MGRKGCQLEDALIFYQYSPRDVIVARLFLQTPAPYAANIKASLVYLHPALAAPPPPSWHSSGGGRSHPSVSCVGNLWKEYGFGEQCAGKPKPASHREMTRAAGWAHRGSVSMWVQSRVSLDTHTCVSVM